MLNRAESVTEITYILFPITDSLQFPYEYLVNPLDLHFDKKSIRAWGFTGSDESPESFQFQALQVGGGIFRFAFTAFMAHNPIDVSIISPVDRMVLPYRNQQH